MIERLAIVGGGIAGLAAAHEARRRGIDVTLVEGSHRLGGKLTTSSFLGLPVDEGADAFLARVPWAHQLCEELGLADELVSPAVNRAQVWLDDERRDFPTDTVLGAPLDVESLRRSGLVSEEAVAAVEADQHRVEPLPAVADDSVSRFVRDRLGNEVFERLVAPLLGGINAGDAERLSLAAAVPQFAAVADQPSLGRALAAQRNNAGPASPVFYAHPAGMTRLVDALADELGSAVRTNTPVHRLTHDNHRWTVETQAGPVVADGVIVATPAPAAATLLEPHTGPTPLSGIEHAGVVMVTFAWPAPAVPVDRGTSGFLVPRSAPLLLTAASIASSKWAHLQRDGMVIIRASAGRFGDERALALDDADLAGALRADLALTMGIEAAPTAQRIVRWPASFPQYTPGHLDRIAEVEAAVATVPQLGLAGAALRGVGIPACIRSGRDAVACLLEG